MYRYPEAVAMIFCKAPIAGQVKTRLQSVLTPGQCANIHTELTHRTLRLATNSQLCPVQLWCSPSTDHAFFTAAATHYALTLQQQRGSDLGERMYQAFCSALHTYKRAVLIGCDCPSLTEADLQIALDALSKNSDVVLAPAEDGGYVLIGLKQPYIELFEDIPWGTATVLTTTRQRIQQQNLHSTELSTQWDIDTPADLARYYAQTQS